MAERLEFLNPQTTDNSTTPANQNKDIPPPDPGIVVDGKAPAVPVEDKPKGERLEWLSPTQEKIKGAVSSKVNPENIETTDSKTGLKIIMNKAAQDVKVAGEKFGQEIRVKEGHLPDVDYDTGTGFNDRMSMSMMDNDAERRAYLSDRYGPKNVMQDPAGEFYIVKNGKKIAPAAGSVVSGMAADVLGHGDELAFMAQGARVGAEAGIPGAIIGAMVGELGGKSIEEVEKRAQGYLRKSPDQEAKELRNSAIIAGLGEGVATPLVGGISRVLEGKVPSVISGATPETKRLTEQTLAMGGVPPVKSALPEMKATQFHQALGEKLTGNQLEHRNVAAIEGEMKNILKSSGMPEDKIPDAMKSVLNTSEAPSYSALGDTIKEHAVKYQEQLTKNVNELTASMNKHLDERFVDLNKQMKATNAGDPAFSQKVAEGIAQNRKEFSEDAQKIYGQIDNLVGDAKVVPMAPIKQIAKKIYDDLPKTEAVEGGTTRVRVETPNGYHIKEETTPGSGGTPIFGDPRILKALADIQKAPDKVSFADAQRIRSSLGDLGRMEDLTPGVSEKDFNDMREAVDRAFNLSTEGQTPQAVALLRKADDFYREGIRKFEDARINQLVAGMRTGIYPDSSKIVSMIFQKGQAQRATEVMKMLPEEMRNKVRGEFGTDLMTQAADKTTGMVSGSSLSRVLAGKHDLLEAAFGPKTTKDIELYARQLATRDEKIPLNALDKDRISESIRAAQKAQESLDKFMDDNYLSELAKPSMAPEAVYKHLVQPGKETELARAIQFFGNNSPQVKQLQQTALVDLLHKAVIPTESGAGMTIGGDALEGALSKYTAKQKALMFPGGLDKDLETIAENAKFLFPPKGSDMAAGLAAGAIKMAVPFGRLVSAGLPGSAATAYGYGALWNYILSRPQTIRYLALGLEQGGPAKKVAMETLRGIVRAGALGMIPDVDENAPRTESSQTPR